MEYLVYLKGDETPTKINADRVTHDKNGAFLFFAGDGAGEPVAAIPLDNVWYIHAPCAQGDS